EVAAEAAHVLERAEALRKVGPVLHGFELRLRERVVVGDVGTRVGLGDAEIGEQQRYWLRGPRCPAVGGHGELAALDRLAMAALRDQALSEPGELAMRGQPAHHVAAED